MIRILPELADALNALYPTQYSHFSKKQAPPFICYLEADTENHYADNAPIAEIAYVNVELYTKIKDLGAEQKIKDLLGKNEIPYTKSPTIFIESEGIFQCVFSIKLLD